MMSGLERRNKKKKLPLVLERDFVASRGGSAAVTLTWSEPLPSSGKTTSGGRRHNVTVTSTTTGQFVSVHMGFTSTKKKTHERYICTDSMIT